MPHTRPVAVSSAALFVALAVAVAGCGANMGASGGGGCAVIQGSCRDQTGLFCNEFGGLPSATLTALMDQCTGDTEPGTWSSTGCSHAGSIGGCRVMDQNACVAVWLYIGTAADGMTSCAEQGGTWVNP